VGGPAGVPEALYTALRTEHGLRDSAPIVEGTALAGDRRRAMTLLGVDPFAERGFRGYAASALEPGRSGALRDLLTRRGAMLAATTAASLGVAPGETLEVVAGGRLQTVTLVTTIAPVDAEEASAAAGIENLLLVDIATAQELLGLEGRLSRIDLRLGSPAEPAADTIAARLPAGLGLERSSSRTETADELTRAFRLNLFTLSLLALLCGAFLIYNSVTFSVVTRRAVFGTLRSLGVTRGGLLGLVLVEVLAVGLVGSVLGVLLGRVLARGLIDMVARTISDHYFQVAVSAPPLDGAGMAAGLGLGLLASVVAGVT
jgi:putative ABC transport system permease protein